MMIERLFYPMSELAKRWGCTVHDLLHLGVQDRAQVCVNIYGMAIGTERRRLETDASEAGLDDEPQTQEERIEAEAHNASFERWKRRTTRDMPHGVFELLHDDLRFIDMPSALPYELSEALKFDGGWWECVFEPPVSIELSHLCMLHDEVVRLSCEVFGSATGATTAPGTIKAAHATPAPDTIKDAPLPDRSHASDSLMLLNQAARRWWANASKDDPATHPGNAAVAAWLIEKGMTKSLAERAASIIRPEWAHKGRKPDA